MIPSPKLDDREFEDIVAEAMRLIPRYCPEWTHHNASDPGVTLIELAAWMTDIILYRLNRVPEKNYIAFLNLLGIKLKPPRAATALLQFNLVDGATEQVVPAGTSVATPQAADEETVTFETDRRLLVSSTKLDRCFSYYNDRYTNNSAVIDTPSIDGVEVFGGAERVERYLYFSDPRFAGCGESSVLRIFLGCPESGGRDLARLLEWEYWNGSRWKELNIAPIEVDRGEACFFGPLKFESTTVNGVEGLWLRGRLADVIESSEHTQIDYVRARVEVSGDGVNPDKAYSNLESDAYVLLDLGKNMYPFGKEPKVDCVLYLACDDLLSTADAEVAIEFHVADPSAIPEANPHDELLLSWEYYDGKRWKLIGQSTPQGIRPGFAEFGFFDDTAVFTKTGSVRFHRPKDLEVVEVNGEERQWVRVRIEQGDYGLPGNYTLENERWVYSEQRPLRPPAVKHIIFRYREEYREIRHCLVFNDFRFTDFTETAKTEFDIFQPFISDSDESPCLYLGYDDRLPNSAHSVFFQVTEQFGMQALPEEGAAIVTRELTRYQAERDLAWESGQRVVWEYWDGDEWGPLSVDDHTSGFTRSGFVDFMAPDDWVPVLKFTEERHWMRARLDMGGYVKSPRVTHILTNVVSARHATTIRDEILGSSDVTPLQEFSLLHGPLLEGEVIEVRERQRPSPEELAEIGGAEAVRVVDETGETEECWVRWRAQESFFESGPRSRHYTIDHQTGIVSFGDGRKGMIPPEGRNNVVATQYVVGGSSAGNVNPHTLTALTRSIAYIESVTNPLAATGGTDRETVEEAKERAPYTIKSRDRAVTSEDFEMLALRASPSLARARCIEDQTHRGTVTLIVVPKANTDSGDLRRKLIPSGEILRYVKRYLDERRLVGTMLSVIRPRYRDLTLRVNLLRRTVGTNDRVRRDIENRLRRYLHPLVGGRDEQGWEFGRSVLKTDLIHVVEEVPGVHGVDSLEILDEERGVHVEQVRIDNDELPYLVHIHIVEKVRDEVM